MGRLIPLAEYLATREALRFATCPDCPVRTECEEARARLWCTEDPPPPELRLRLVEPPDIVA